MNKNERKYYIIIFILVIVYWFVSFHVPLDEVTKRITTTTTLIAAVTFWLQLRRTERLNESNYIKDLNNQFITNKDMSLVEHELELYYNQYEALLNGREKLTQKEMETIHLGLNQSRASDECQKLINYLVYLESLAALVDRQVIHLDVIDDLFSYRFFIAVNNPVVQQDELLPYKDFYQGIFRLSERWTETHHNKKILIPMEQYTLYKVAENWTKETIIIPLDISRARSDDKKTEIAHCLYHADHFIYPEAFGEEEDKAVKAISRIIGMDGSLLDYRNLIVARYNGQVCGVALMSDGTSDWDKDAIRTRVGTELLPERLLEGFNHASDKYFSKFKKDNPDQDEIEIVAFCVDEGFRRKKIGSALLGEVVKRFAERKITLVSLDDNAAAIHLYETKGFSKEPETFEGFAPAGLRRPICCRMIRPAEK